jgi:hypothetical protein
LLNIHFRSPFLWDTALCQWGFVAQISKQLHVLETMGTPGDRPKDPRRRTISTAPLQRPENIKNKIMKLQRNV